jgi:phenylalanyl-tRNA synthetase beta chain
MKVPYSWLREYCDPGLGAEEVAALLSAKAVEVERVRHVGVASGEGFVIGRVVSAEQHPNADRLSVCVVDTGDGERTIVCGAPNVRAGLTVAVATPGSRLPDGTKLRKAKLRGVESNGMILSETELEIGVDSDGIMELEEGPAAGTALAEVLPITDQVLELDLNPNRSDCLGVYGVAREVHAITGAPLAPPPWDTDADPTGTEAIESLASVSVEVPELCPRFTVRAFLGIAIAPSPIWLKARLTAAGQRPISNIVDITNYVMLLTGQPLHAYDLDLVPGGELIIRRAADGEKMHTLDGNERALDPEAVLVCDREQPVGIAGVMGGEVSEVSDSTSNVLLEAATWNGPNILRTSSSLGLRSEASTRYEKQIHPELAIRAQRVASKLLVEVAGATLSPGTIDACAENPPAHVVSLTGARLDSLLGTHIEMDEAKRHLQLLEFDVRGGDGELTATVPLERHYDVTREVDLIEEVARLHGLDELPRTLPEHGERGGLSADQHRRRLAEDVMRDLGFDEIVSWSFSPDGQADKLRLAADDPRRSQVTTVNPLSADSAAMRTELIGGLLDAARHNLARGAGRVALFESGRVYLRQAPPPAGSPLSGSFGGRMPSPIAEPHRIAALACGPLAPPGWSGESAAAGFFELKGVIEALCAQFAISVAFTAEAEPFLHPGRSAAIEIGGEAIGWLGELHPAVAGAWDLPGGVAFSLDLAPIADAAGAVSLRYEDVTSFPPVLQDLAVVIDDDVPADRVQATVRGAGGELLRAVSIFDLYRGDQIGRGRKSLALRLEFQAPDRTLTDEEVAERRQAISGALEGIGGSLRG